MISNGHYVIILIVTMYNFIPSGHYVIILIVTMYNFIPNSPHVNFGIFLSTPTERCGNGNGIKFWSVHVFPSKVWGYWLVYM